MCVNGEYSMWQHQDFLRSGLSEAVRHDEPPGLRSPWPAGTGSWHTALRCQRDGTAIPTKCRASPLPPARSWATNTSSGMEEACTATSIWKGITWVDNASLPLLYQRIGTHPPLSCWSPTTKGQRAQVLAKDPSTSKASCDLILVICIRETCVQQPILCGSEQLLSLSCHLHRHSVPAAGSCPAHSNPTSSVFPDSLISRLQNSQISSTPIWAADWGHNCRANNKALIHQRWRGDHNQWLLILLYPLYEYGSYVNTWLI